MKSLLLLMGVLCLFGPLLAQTKKWPALKVSDEGLIREEARYIVNRFKTAVRKAVECPLFNTTGITGLFTEDAFIEVSTLRAGIKRRYLPGEYFETLNGLVCGKGSLYDSVRITHLPVPPELTKILYKDGGCIVHYHIAQKFSAIGLMPGKAGNYLEITIKTVIMEFHLSRDGVLEGKISKIIAEHPNIQEIHGGIHFR